MIAAFFTWWLGQLTDLLPLRLRRAVASEADALLLMPATVAGELNLQAALRRNGVETPLGEFALTGAALQELSRPPGQAVALRLARADLLEKTLTLPLAAQAELGQAIAFEMDRETPFAADEVYWAHCIDAIDRQHGRLSARLMLLPKARLQPLLAALAAQGIDPKWIEVADGPAGCRRLPLDPEGALPQDRGRRLVKPLAVACAVLALASAATPFVLQSLAISALDREVRAAQGKAGQAEDLRRQIALLSRSAELVAGELDKAGRPLDLIATLTRLIPDDTFLTEMDIRQGKVMLSGRSMNAARLIGVLAGDGHIRNPTFSAPVTRIEGMTIEVFTITADAGPHT